MATRACLLLVALAFLAVSTGCSARVLQGRGSRPRYGTQQSSSSAFFQGDSGQATADAWSSSGTFDRQPSSSPMFSAPQYGNYQPQNGYMSYQQPSNTQGPTYNAGSPPTAQSQGTNQPIQPQGTTTGGTVDNSVLQGALDQHNSLRSRHGATALTWSTQLASGAQQWADNCNFQHSNGGDGENLAMGYATFESAIQDWYNEVSQYNYGNPGFSEGTGHFTQIVWKSTTALGCGWNAGCKLYVCRYSPAGNIIGQFEQNVSPVVSNT